MKLSLLVLAAGIGSRYGGLKQVDPVGPSGEIIIDYSIYDAIKAGFQKVVFVIRKDIEKDFKDCIGTRFENKIETSYVYQELDKLPNGFKVPADRQKPWGTAHAILSAKDEINEPFAVINADDFYGRSGYQLLADALKGENANFETPQYYMVGFRLGNTLSEHGYVSRGICNVASDGALLDVVERTKIEKTDRGAKFANENGEEVLLNGDEIVSMNMWGFRPSLFSILEDEFKIFLQEKISDLKAEFFIPTVIAKLIKNKKAKVKVLRSADPWFGITYREDKNTVVQNIRKLIEKGTYPVKI